MGVPSFMRRRGEVPPCAVLAGRVTTWESHNSSQPDRHLGHPVTGKGCRSVQPELVKTDTRDPVGDDRSTKESQMHPRRGLIRRTNETLQVANMTDCEHLNSTLCCESQMLG